MTRQLLMCLFAAFAIQMALPEVGFACTCTAAKVADRAAYQEWFQQRTVVFRGTVIADELFDRRSPGVVYRQGSRYLVAADLTPSETTGLRTELGRLFERECVSGH